MTLSIFRQCSYIFGLKWHLACRIMTRKYWLYYHRPNTSFVPLPASTIFVLLDEELKTFSVSGQCCGFVHTCANLSPTQLAYMHASAQVRTRRICCVLTVVSLLNLLRLNFILVSIGSTPAKRLLVTSTHSGRWLETSWCNTSSSAN
jgi:hypothetical protein